jgi:hypothetical protein
MRARRATFMELVPVLHSGESASTSASLDHQT